MARWRVERGVVQQAEALVRGFYEVCVVEQYFVFVNDEYSIFGLGLASRPK